MAHKIIGWDWDGTVVDSVRPQINFNLEMARKFGIEDKFPPASDIDAWRASSASNLKEFLESSPFPKETHAEIMHSYENVFSKNLYKDISFYPGVFELMTKLASLGYPQFIISHNHHRNLLPSASKFRIPFMYILGKEQLDADFSGSKALALAWIKNKSKKTPLIYVGDTFFDYQASVSANVGFEGVSWGYHLNGGERGVSVSSNADELEKRLLG